MTNTFLPLAPANAQGGLSFFLILLYLLCLFFPAGVLAAEAPQTPRKALVLFTFGTTYAQTKDPLEVLRKEIAARHPGLTVRLAYSSAHVAASLKAKGQQAETLPQTLADLSADGYTHIAVQSLHVIPGLEFDIARDITGRYANLPKGIRRVSLGRPLIGSHEDAKAVASILLDALPAERNTEDAVVLVGHGAASPSGSLAYPALQCFLTRLDPRILVGTIEGPFTLESILSALKAAGSKKVWLLPLLTAVGDHADNDIFGNEDDSWKKTFSNAGIQAIPISRGLLAVPALAALWADHADQALADLSD
ncbi:MAG: sirohydrochlorin cobaltochelatase [Desulfovibrio sp.]|jgi:sirohydrochlorin cobaltochelatase|nr:sirohydrochlorin cobaltochelatase [Desulfovibrio sp.]